MSAITIIWTAMAVHPKLVLDENGEVKNEYVDADGNV